MGEAGPLNLPRIRKAESRKQKRQASGQDRPFAPALRVVADAMDIGAVEAPNCAAARAALSRKIRIPKKKFKNAKLKKQTAKVKKLRKQIRKKPNRCGLCRWIELTLLFRTPAQSRHLASDAVVIRESVRDRDIR